MTTWMDLVVQGIALLLHATARLMVWALIATTFAMVFFPLSWPAHFAENCIMWARR